MITIDVQAPATAGTMTNIARVTGTEPDTNPANNEAKVVTPVTAVLAATATAPPAAGWGGRGLTGVRRLRGPALVRPRAGSR